MPDVQVKFGREVLVLDTWARRKQYDAFCMLLGPGINSHLAENDFLRDIFEIVAPIIQAQEPPAHAQQHLERCRKVNCKNLFLLFTYIFSIYSECSMLLLLKRERYQEGKIEINDQIFDSF